MYMDEEGITLATEILGELKASARRWFLAFLIMLGIEIATVAGFLWYLSLPTEEYAVTQDTDNGGDNYAIGGNYNGASESGVQTEGNPR